MNKTERQSRYATNWEQVARECQAVNAGLLAALLDIQDATSGAADYGMAHKAHQIATSAIVKANGRLP